MTRKKTLRYSSILIALGISLGSLPIAQAMSPVDDKTASGTDPYIYTSVLESLKAPDGKELNSTNELSKDVEDLILNRKGWGNYKGQTAWALPLNSNNSIDPTNVYKDSEESTKEYKTLSNDDKKRAQVAYSLLNATYKADANDDKNIPQESLDKLKELDINLSNKNDITAAATILLNKAFDSNYKADKASTTVSNAADKLYEIAPQFENSLTDLDDLVVTNSNDRVFIVTDQGPALRFNYWNLTSNNDTSSSKKTVVSGSDNLGVYKGISKKDIDGKSDNTFISAVSLDTNHTSFKDNSAFPEESKSEDLYKNLTDDKKKEAYVAASLIFNTNDEATDKDSDYSKTLKKLKEIGIDEEDHNKLSAGAHLLLLDAFNDDFSIPEGTSDDIIKIYQTLKGAASSLKTDIKQETLTTRSKLDSLKDAPEHAYLLPDNTLYRFDTLEFGEFDIDNNAGKDTNNSNNSKDNNNSSKVSDKDSAKDTNKNSNKSKDNSDSDSDIDSDNDSNSNSDSISNSDSDSNSLDSQNSNSTANGNTISRGVNGNNSTYPELQQARKDYSGTFSGGTSSSVEEGEGIDEEGSSVDTGSPTHNIISKISTIF